MYRHPIGELSRSAVLDVGLKCTHSCRFCYYSYLDKSDEQFRGMRRAAFRSLEECKAILDGLKAHGFQHFDYTGGEPSLHPQIVEITRYAHRELGLAGRMITLGQFLMRRMPGCRTPRLIDDLLDAGLVNFLFSVHAVDDALFARITGEQLSRLRAAMEHLDARGFDYTTNTTVFEWNATHLPAIARALVQHRVYLHNFILMNAYYEWNRDGKAFGVQARYETLRPYLREAIETLAAHGVAANIRYAPLCAVRGLEQHLVGVVGVRYDPHEWMNEAGHFGGPPEHCARPLAVPRGDIDPIFRKRAVTRTLASGVRIVAERGPGVKVFPEQCAHCAAREVCDGVDPNYLVQYGASEFEPYAGPLWRFPVHEARAAYPAPFLVKTAPQDAMREAVAPLVRQARRPRVSVIIPCYNYGRYLPEAVDSVLAQTFADFEIVIVDDGSTDDSRAVAEQLAAMHPERVRVIGQERSGQPAIARNRGISEARGEYILCLDADDKIAPTMLERCVALLDAEPAVAVAYTDRRDFDGVDQIVQAGEYDFDRLRFANHMSYCALFRRTVWETVGGYRTNVKGCEDWDFWVAAGARGFSGKRIPEPLFWYRRHDRGVFQDALRDFARLRDQIVLNNPTAYPPTVVAAARDRLASGSGAAGCTGSPGGRGLRSLVSVIVTTRNRPQWLRRAVASVLAQRWRPLEVIVVNDAGEDVSGVLAELDCERLVTSIRLHERRERSAARNAALALARGEYVAYLDDDDWWDPDHLVTLVEALETSEAALVYSDARRVHELHQGDGYVPVAVDQPLHRDFDHEALLTGNYIPICCVLHRRSCLEVVGGFDETLATHEDWELWLRFAERWPLRRIPRVTCSYTWREDGSSTTSSRREDFLRTHAVVLQRHPADPGRFPRAATIQHALLEQIRRERTAYRPYEVSIVVAVCNRVDLTRQCCTALAEATDGVPWELVVVDDGSTDDTAAFLATLGGDVQVVRHEQSLGLVRAWNTGAAVARGRFLLFLRNDLIPQPGWLPPLLEELNHRPEVAIVGARVVSPDGRVAHAGMAVSRRLGMPYPIYRSGPGRAPSVSRRREVQAVSGGCLLVRRELFEAVGGFHDGYHRSVADIDLCLQIRHLGGRVVYQPASELVCVADQSPERHETDDRDSTLFARRWAGRLVADEDAAHASEGLALRCTGVGPSQVVTPFVDAQEGRRWDRVAEAQRRTLAGRPATARSLLDNAEAWPNDPAVLEWAAEVLCPAAGVPERAAAFAGRARALRMAAAAGASAAGAALAAGDLATARTRIAEALAAMPAHAEALLLRGELALRENKPEDATRAFSSALAAGADRCRALLGRARAAALAQQGDEAWAAFRSVLEDAPDNEEAIDGLLQLGLAEERWQALAEVLAPLVERFPDRTDLRFALAHAWLGCGRRAEAREHYEVLRSLAPTWPPLEELGTALAVG